MKQTDTPTLIKAMRILARDIQSGDGVANAAIAEAADRLEQQYNALRKVKAYIRAVPCEAHPEGFDTITPTVESRILGFVDAGIVA